MNYWQVAAGEGSRDYSDVFLKFGIMLVGGGDPGLACIAAGIVIKKLNKANY